MLPIVCLSNHFRNLLLDILFSYLLLYHFFAMNTSSYAKEEQSAAMEQDDREGLVMTYLDMLLPADWDSMDIYQRKNYISDPNDVTRPVGTMQRTTVSNIEIWCECFGKPKEDFKPSDSYAISAIMARLTSWEKTGASTRLSIYGKQRIYKRK